MRRSSARCMHKLVLSREDIFCAFKCLARRALIALLLAVQHGCRTPHVEQRAEGSPTSSKALGREPTNERQRQMEANRALYRVMGVSRDATQAQLKKAYHNLARRYHPDKNPEDGARFTEISNAYNLLSDPRKRQLYDQFGDQGVQMADVMAQQGVPDWILMPAAQRMVGMVVCGMVVLFVVLLPLFLLLRSDEEVDWPWGVAAIPVWLLGLCFAVVAARIAYEVAQAKEMSAIICSDTGATVAYFALVLLVQILLVVRLDNPSSALTYTSALVPFYLAMAPSICSAAYALAGAAYRRWRPLPATPPVTLLQMEPYLHALAGRVLLCLTLWLAGLKGDGVITANWWLVLLPLWIQMVLLAVRWQRASRVFSPGSAPAPAAAAAHPRRSESLASRVWCCLRSVMSSFSRASCCSPCVPAARRITQRRPSVCRSSPRWASLSAAAAASPCARAAFRRLSRGTRMATRRTRKSPQTKRPRPAPPTARRRRRAAVATRTPAMHGERRRQRVAPPLAIVVAVRARPPTKPMSKRPHLLRTAWQTRSPMGSRSLPTQGRRRRPDARLQTRRARPPQWRKLANRRRSDSHG